MPIAVFIEAGVRPRKSDQRDPPMLRDKGKE
jgi:hypothetical protein